MSAPFRVQLSRAKGWRMPPNTVKVDRTTRWGNPFSWKDARDEWGGTDAEARQSAVEMFRAHIVDGEPAPRDGGGDMDLHSLRCHHFAHRHELRGKNLACWCPLDQPCHADVLLELANPPQGPSDG